MPSAVLTVLFFWMIKNLLLRFVYYIRKKLPIVDCEDLRAQLVEVRWFLPLAMVLILGYVHLMVLLLFTFCSWKNLTVSWKVRKTESQVLTCGWRRYPINFIIFDRHRGDKRIVFLVATLSHFYDSRTTRRFNTEAKSSWTWSLLNFPACFSFSSSVVNHSSTPGEDWVLMGRVQRQE